MDAHSLVRLAAVMLAVWAGAMWGAMPHVESVSVASASPAQATAPVATTSDDDSPIKAVVPADIYVDRMRDLRRQCAIEHVDGHHGELSLFATREGVAAECWVRGVVDPCCDPTSGKFMWNAWVYVWQKQQ